MADERDDETEHDDGPPPAINQQGIVDALQGAIERGEKVVLLREGMQHEQWSGFPLVMSDDLLLMRTLHDFDLDGFAVLRLRDVTGIVSADSERFFERVLRAEGKFERAAPPKPVLLRTWRSVLESVRAHYRFAIVECERSDDDDFLIGELAGVDDDGAAVHYIQVNGTREAEVTRVPVDEITLVRFDEQYVNLYGKYSVADDRH